MKHSKFSEQIEEAISNPTPLGVKLKQARALGLTATIPSVTSCLTISIRCTRPALPCPALPSPYMHCCLLNVNLQRPLEGGQPCHCCHGCKYSQSLEGMHIPRACECQAPC